MKIKGIEELTSGRQELQWTMVWWSAAQRTVVDGGARCELRSGTGPRSVTKPSTGQRARRELGGSGGVAARELGGGGDRVMAVATG